MKKVSKSSTRKKVDEEELIERNPQKKSSQQSKYKNNDSEDENEIKSKTKNKKNKNEDEELPKIVVGPVIGKVTDLSARILLEVNIKSRVSIILTDEKGNKTEEGLDLEANFPAIFIFRNLKQGTHYSIAVESNNELLNYYSLPRFQDYQISIKRASPYGGFRTMLPQMTKMKFAVVSCNSIDQELKKNLEFSLWKDLSKRVCELDYIFHIGDQVYMDNLADKGNLDNPYEICKDDLKDCQHIEDFLEHKEYVREKIREQYRFTWSYPPTAEVLRNVPNIMILDDHEVYDDFGFRPSYKNRNSFDYFFYEQCRFVYYQYQKQLHLDIDFNDINKDLDSQREHLFEVIGGHGFFFSEYRACKTWLRKEGDKSNLGKQQLNDIKTCFNPEGLFKNCSSAFFISGTPLVGLNRWISKFLEAFENDLQEQWSMNCKSEQIMLLNLFKTWQEKTCKPFTLISGDIHMGAIAKIFHEKRFCFKQLVASSISQVENSALLMDGVKVAYDLSENIGSGFRTDQEHFIRYHNYAIMEIQTFSIVTDVQGYHIVEQKNNYPVKARNQTFNPSTENDTTSASCSCTCNVF